MFASRKEAVFVPTSKQQREIEASFKALCVVLRTQLNGKECHLEFRPKKHAFNRTDSIITQALQNARKEQGPSIDDQTLNSIEFAVRSRCFDLLQGTMSVSCTQGKQKSFIVALPLRFTTYARVVRLLDKPRSTDQERMASYLRRTSKRARTDPVFFKMTGTVSTGFESLVVTHDAQ